MMAHHSSSPKPRPQEVSSFIHMYKKDIPPLNEHFYIHTILIKNVNVLIMQKSNLHTKIESVLS